jgi:outer membrane lipoprotein SlyB
VPHDVGVGAEEAQGRGLSATRPLPPRSKRRYTGRVKTTPETAYPAASEAEQRLKRAELEARKAVEDKANTAAMMLLTCLAAVGGIIGGTQGVAGSTIGAVAGAAVGGIVGSAYKRRALRLATKEALRKHESG